MKLIVNTASTYKGGGVQVARSFIEECQQHKEHEFHIVLGQLLSRIVDTTAYPENFYFYEIGYRPATKIFSISSHDQFFTQLETMIKPDAVFTTSGPAYWRSKAPHIIGYNLPHYIYTDSPFYNRIPPYKRLKWKAKGKVIQYFFKRDADACVVQTSDVNHRLRKWIQSDAVYTVSNTVSSHYLNHDSYPLKLPQKADNEFRFLTLSAWYAHKNIEIIRAVLDALDEKLKRKIRFVLTLPEEDYNRLFPNKYRKFIYNLGPVRPEEGPSLYNECDAMFLPTLLECFSASYAEAMVMGKPILTSDLSFAKSICQSAALYCDPVNPIQIIEQMKILMDCSEIRAKLVNEGKKQLSSFPSAQDRASQYLNICNKIAHAS